MKRRVVGDNNRWRCKKSYSQGVSLESPISDIIHYNPYMLNQLQLKKK